jgi:hypothetical protein
MTAVTSSCIRIERNARCATGSLAATRTREGVWERSVLVGRPPFEQDLEADIVGVD